MWTNLLPCFQEEKISIPTKCPTKVSTEVPRKTVHSSGRGSPVLFSLVLFLDPQKKGEAFLLTVGAFLLTVKLLRLQSLKALIRCTFPL